MSLFPTRYLQHFWIHGKHYGTAQRTTVPCHETKTHPDSKSYFCPVCGEIWAQCPIEDSATGLFRPYVVTTVPCSKHHKVSQWLVVAGTLYQSWDKEFVCAMPEAVLKRELEILLKTYPEEIV